MYDQVVIDTVTTTEQEQKKLQNTQKKPKIHTHGTQTNSLSY